MCTSGCRGLTQPVQIYIEGIAELVYIEDCVNCTVIVECCLRGLAVHKGVNVDLFVAAEAPHISIQDIHAASSLSAPTAWTAASRRCAPTMFHSTASFEKA